MGLFTFLLFGRIKIKILKLICIHCLLTLIQRRIRQYTPCWFDCLLFALSLFFFLQDPSYQHLASAFVYYGGSSLQHHSIVWISVCPLLCSAFFLNMLALWFIQLSSVPLHGVFLWKGINNLLHLRKRYLNTLRE